MQSNEIDYKIIGKLISKLSPVTTGTRKEGGAGLLGRILEG